MRSDNRGRTEYIPRMPVLHLEAEVSRDQLVEAVKGMPAAERDAFVDEVLSLRQDGLRPGMAPAEAEADLLGRIHAGPTQEQWARFHELNDRRRSLAITEADKAELQRLVDVVEEYQAARAEALVAPVRIRGVSLQAS